MHGKVKMEAGKCAFLTEIALYLGNGEKRVHIVNVDHCEVTGYT